MHALIDRHRATIASLCRRYGVRRLEVFGSAARGIDFNPATSDADFLVEFDPDRNLPPLQQFFGLADALESVLDRHVDLVETGAIRNPYFLRAIAKKRVLVYAA